MPRTEADTIARLTGKLHTLLEGLEVRDVIQEAKVGEETPDLLVKVQTGKKERTLVIEVKRIGEPRFIMQSISYLQRLVKQIPGAYPVFAAPYITESSRELCKESGIGYLDLVGNVYLRFDNVFIERTRPETIQCERRSLRTLVAPKTGRVIRILLMSPNRAFGVTELADDSGVSSAHAYKVSNTLEDKGFVRRDPDRKVVLTKPGELLETWAASVEFDKNDIVTAYSLERTPEAIVKRVREVSRQFDLEYALTLFAGAAMVAPFVRYYDVAFYAPSNVEEWMRHLDLREVESGSNVQVVIPRDDGVFMNMQIVDEVNVVSDIQLFADLYNNPARGREQAEFLRKERIDY
ncbi:MAG: type IV toxin-antitoxin system AbiEi family antitoxin [Thermoplasmata archaeon]